MRRKYPYLLIKPKFIDKKGQRKLTDYAECEERRPLWGNGVNNK